MNKIALTPKQLLAASQIAMGESQKRAAEIAKVTEQTVCEWKQKPEFIAFINSTKLTILNESQDKLRALAFAAIENLSRILQESENDKLRLDAAKFVLETIRISPSKESGLWHIGPTTKEGVISDELKKKNPLHSLLDGHFF